MKRAILLTLFLVQNVFAAENFRTIAILENERMLAAEPNIQLSDYFKSSSTEERIRAVMAAARIGDRAILPELLPLTKDSDPQVRKYVAFALGQIRAKGGLVSAIELTRDSDLEVRRLAIEAIGRIGGLDTASFVVPFLDDEHQEIREQAALALALIKDKATVEKLIQKSKEKDTAQWSYVYALYRLADERAVPALHEILSNAQPSPSTGDPSSVLFALKALWSLKKPLTPEEINSLLQNSDQRIQQNAMDVLAASAEKDACAALHKSYSKMTSISQGKALDTMGALQCVGEERPESPVLLGAWFAAKGKSEKDQSLSLLQEGLKHSAWVVRWRVAQALADLQEASATPLLKTLMNDPDSAVRLAALDSLSGFLPATAELFVPLLQNQDFAVRATAVDALGKTKDPKYLALLLQTNESSKDPSEIEGRVALLDILPDFNNSLALKVYESALMDSEFTIRRHAIDGLKKILGTSPYYFHGELKDPEEFLFLKGKVTAKTMNRYPADFGKETKPVDVTMKLEKGNVKIRLFAKDAPIHAANFLKLAGKDFYNGLRIHRVVPNFVIQGGDPRGDGWGGAGEVIHDQINLLVYKRGMVGMPIAGKDTGGSQFFITQSRQPHLDGNYTIFGEVVEGMEVVDQTEVGDKILSVIVLD